MDVSKYVICNTRRPSKHCKTNCFHGRPHLPAKGMKGSCHTTKESCTCMEGRAGQVMCRKLTKKEIKYYEGKQK